MDLTFDYFQSDIEVGYYNRPGTKALFDHCVGEFHMFPQLEQRNVQSCGNEKATL